MCFALCLSLLCWFCQNKIWFCCSFIWSLLLYSELTWFSLCSLTIFCTDWSSRLFNGILLFALKLLIVLKLLLWLVLRTVVSKRWICRWGCWASCESIGTLCVVITNLGAKVGTGGTKTWVIICCVCDINGTNGVDGVGSRSVGVCAKIVIYRIFFDWIP